MVVGRAGDDLATSAPLPAAANEPISMQVITGCRALSTGKPDWPKVRPMSCRGTELDARSITAIPARIGNQGGRHRRYRSDLND